MLTVHVPLAGDVCDLYPGILVCAGVVSVSTKVIVCAGIGIIVTDGAYDVRDFEATLQHGLGRA